MTSPTLAQFGKTSLDPRFVAFPNATLAKPDGESGEPAPPDPLYAKSPTPGSNGAGIGTLPEDGTLMELGAIGELVGGVAVIASLLYLGFQVRQSNQDGRTESHRAFMAQWNHTVHDALLQRETSTVLRDAARDFEGLRGDDQLIAHGYWQAITLLGQEAHALRRLGHLDPGFENDVNRVVLSIVKMPGATQWWRRAEIHMPSEYTTYLRELDRDDIRPLEEALPWFVANDQAQGPGVQS